MLPAAATVDLLMMLVGGAIGLGGLLVMLLALFADRSRGRARCPRCWYDMGGLAVAAACPECGRTPRSFKALYRTRRRYGRAAAGAALCFAGAATMAMPTVRRDGWYSMAPTSALIWLTPPAGQPAPAGAARSIHPALNELSRRLERGRLRDWQWRVLIRRSNIIVHREAWPAGVPLQIAMQQPGWTPFCEVSVSHAQVMNCWARIGTVHPWSCGSGRPLSGTVQSLGMVPRGEELGEFIVTVQWVPLSHTTAITSRELPQVRAWTGVMRFPIRSVGTPAEIVSGHDDPEITEAVVRGISNWWAVRQSTIGWPHAESLNIGFSVAHAPDPALIDTAVGLVFELVFDDEVMQSRTVAPAMTGAGALLREDLNVTLLAMLTGEGARPEHADLGRWHVRVRGDPVVSLVDWQKSRFWSGQMMWRVSDLLEAFAQSPQR